MRIHFLLLALLIFQSNNLQCGEENIEHCLKCGEGPDINSCETCEDKFFHFLDNVLCLPCDDPLFGQAGCGGQCNNTLIYNSKYDYYDFEFSCNTECKEGYYNQNNKCISCSDGCGKCSYDNNKYSYTCQECVSNQYKLTNKGKCNKCYLSNCDKCHYEGENTICEECSSGYYLKDNACTQCKWTLQSEGKICEVCSDDKTKYNPDSCNCITGYTKGDSNQCVKCPENCYSCGYNSQDKKSKCFNCDEGYTLNSKGICVSCGENCKYCYLDANENPLCLSCMSGYTLNENKNCLICDDYCESCIKTKDNTIECTKCINEYGLLPNKTCTLCPPNCQNCFWKEEKGDFGCSKCTSSFYIIGKDDLCVSSRDINEIGFEGCNEFYYDKTSPDNNQYKCTGCTQGYTLVYNEYKCLLNLTSNLEFINGCLNASYNSDKKRYECIKCDSEYIYILNEQKCLSKEETNLSSYCSEANNTGTKDIPKYSCINCRHNNYTKIRDTSKNIYDCENPALDFYLTNCAIASKNSNGDKECSGCKYGLSLYFDNQSSKNRCQDSCKSDSYLIYNFCPKCDDIYYGNPGCISNKGCYYKELYSKVMCNECKEGYFQSSEGCSPCSKKNKGCKKCSMSNNNFECEECFDGYNLNTNNKLCELVKCKEYPEIAVGCLICDEKLNEYKQKSKCQSCKDGYFKTYNESCVYCKSYGGNGCEQCAYSESNKIICAYCPKGSILNNYGQCLKCDEQFEGCSNCRYIYIDKTYYREKLICTECKDNYYLTSDGYCIYPKNYKEDIDNCESISTKITNEKEFITFGDDIINNDYTIKEEKFSISPFCYQCSKGYYYLNGKCFKINYDDCIFSSIFSNNSLNDICYSLCSDSNNYIMINYNIYTSIKRTIIDSVNEINIIKQKNNININLYTIMNDYHNFNYYSEDDLFQSLNMNAPMCIGNLGTGDKNNPINLRKCREAIYNQMEDKYECTECMSGYTLDNEKKICIQKIKLTMKEHPGLECDVENIGTDPEPIYSCKSCYNRNHILATTENKAKICVSSNNYDSDINYCTEVYADTNYIKNTYNCTNCSDNRLLYDSKFYNRKICQNIYSKIKRFYDFNITEFSEDKESVEAKNGICESKKLFTPDNINCFLCNSVMRGCKGSCTFSLHRENFLECEENGCKSSYIEIQKGVCDKCENANPGCIECHYEDKYPSDYKGFKRKRRFVCDQCREGYLVGADGNCYSCYSGLGDYYCEKCGWDENNNNELVCLECSSGYFLDEAGKCSECQNGNIRVNQNKCVSCDNKKYGGIEGCSLCKSDNNIITECEFCDKGYILLASNKTCLKISENIQLRNYPNCKILETYNGGSLSCSLCELYSYALLSYKGEDNCVSLDSIPSLNIKYNKFCKTFEIVYSKYSCKECLDNKYFDQYDKLTKFTFESNQTSFCDLYYYYDLGFCKEAIISEEDGKVKYSCHQCYEDGLISYNSKLKIYYCNYNLGSSELTCLINNCQECQKDNNKICLKCLDKYEINSITGSCVKKTEKIPSIIFKDIYGLQMNQGNSLNGQELRGPSVILRGITNSQINEGHAFSFYLSIELKRSYIKGQTQEVPMVCQLIGDGVDESKDELNMVEYFCNGNLTSGEIYQLKEYAGDDIGEIGIAKLKEDSVKNLGIIMPSNLNDMSFANIKEQNSQFSLKKFLNTITFIPDKIENQTSNNYYFDFTLKGKINEEINKINLDFNLPLVEVEKSAKCNLNIEGDKSADLNCKINLEEYKNYSIFSFKLIDYEDEERTVILSQINEIYLKTVNDIDADNRENNGKKGFKTLYIIIIAAGGALIGIGITVFLFMKKKKPREMINICNQNMPNQGINPVKIENKINKNMIKKFGNKSKKINKKNTGKKLKKGKKNEKTEGDINENESSKRKIIPFNNKNK